MRGTDGLRIQWRQGRRRHKHAPPNKQIVLKASGGKFTVTIPAGALPAGTDPGTLKVTPITVADTLSDGQIIAAYSLEPDGLRLSAPATLEVTLDPASVHELVGHHSGIGGDEILPLQVTGQTDTALTLTAPISHFSIAAFEDSPVQRIETRIPPHNALLGQPFTVRYRVTPRLSFKKTYTKSTPDGRHIVPPGTSSLTVNWNVKTWDSAFNAVATSGSLGDGVLNAANASNLTSYRDIDFTTKCTTQAGPFKLAFSGAVMIPADPTYALVPNAKPPAVACLAHQCCVGGVALNNSCTGTCKTDADCTKNSTISFGTDLRFTEDGHPDSATCIDPSADLAGDFVDSESSITPAFKGKQVDILAYGYTQVTYTQAQVDDMFNVNPVYQCGQSDATRTVVCAGGGATPMPAGKIDEFFMQLGADVPLADAVKSYIYSLVLDSDGDPTNNWIPQAPYDWDYFQGADLWYQIVWDHLAKKWSLSAKQVSAAQAAVAAVSTARAIIEGDAITFYVSASELPAPTGYRVTAFGHDGNFTVSSRSGDVSGANPTDPLTPMP